MARCHTPKQLEAGVQRGDRLLSMREVAALKRANLRTVESAASANLAYTRIGHRRFLWLSQVIDFPIKVSLTEDQARALVEIPAKRQKSLRKAVKGSHSGNINPSPTEVLIAGKTYRSARAIYLLDGSIAPSAAAYKYTSLAELDAAVDAYRKAQLAHKKKGPRLRVSNPN